MQMLQCLRPVLRASSSQRQAYRHLSVAPSTSQFSAPVPWFVDPEPVPEAFSRRSDPPHLPSKHCATPPQLPSNVPNSLKELHAVMWQSPHLEPSTLVICEPKPKAPGPPLPHTLPKGRRKRGRSYAGEGVIEPLGGIWSWVVMAQVSSISSRDSCNLILFLRSRKVQKVEVR